MFSRDIVIRFHDLKLSLYRLQADTIYTRLHTGCWRHWCLHKGKQKKYLTLKIKFFCPASFVFFLLSCLLFWSSGPDFLSLSFGPGFFCLVIFVQFSSWPFCPGIFVRVFMPCYFCPYLLVLVILLWSFLLIFLSWSFGPRFLSCLLSWFFLLVFLSCLLSFLCPGLIVLFLVYSICRICLCPGIFSCSFCPGFLSCSFGPVIIAQAFCPVHLDLLLLARSFSLFWSFCPVQIYLYPVRRCRGRTGGTKS